MVSRAISRAQHMARVGGQAGPSGPTDPFWSSVVNLTTFDGANGATTFPNLAPVAAPAFTPGGGTVPVLSNAQSEYGTTSLLVNGTGPNHYVNTLESALYTIGTGDVTIEFSFRWVSSTPSCHPYYITQGPTAPSPGSPVDDTIFYPSAGNMWVEWRPTGGTMLTTGAYVMAANVWNKLAMCRSGTTGRLFINGTLRDTKTNSANMLGPARLWLGAMAGTFNAYYANFRMTRAARYTASYTPATGPFPTS